MSSDYTIVRFIVDRHGRPINKPFWTLGEAKSERSRLMHEVPSQGPYKVTHYDLRPPGGKRAEAHPVITLTPRRKRRPR